MVEIVDQSPGVQQLVHMRTMHLGPEEVLVGMKIVVDDATRAGDASKFVDVLEARLRAEMPILRRIYVEIGAPEDPRAELTAATPASE